MHLKRENVPWFKLLFEVKFILTSQTRRAHCELTVCQVNKGKLRVMCDNRFF